VSDVRFGFSTSLFLDARLTREHLVHIAAHGFEHLELVAMKSHFDYGSADAVRELAEWLSDTRLALHSVHAPTAEAVHGTTRTGWLSLASGDEARRQAAVGEAQAALAMARDIPFDFLVVHLGTPASAQTGPVDNQRDAARRSADTLIQTADGLGVRLAFEIIQNPLSSAEALVRFLEDDLDGLNATVCLDYGHGHLTGDLPDVIEAVSGHVGTTHVHDNDGRRDAHLPPYQGSIDWSVALMETQKIGYDGAYIFELAPTADPVPLLVKAARARVRLEQAFVTF
jgi:sugar phosphate isomerase/epimerase